jgi:hypothetical protein
MERWKDISWVLSNSCILSIFCCMWTTQCSVNN